MTTRRRRAPGTTMTLRDWSTVAEVAARRGVTPQAVRLALKQGRLAGRKWGATWMIPAAAADYVKQRWRRTAADACFPVVPIAAARDAYARRTQR